MALVRKLQPGAKTTGKTMRYENVGTYDAEEFIKALTQANRSGYSFTNELFNTLLNAIRNGDVSKNADGSWTINNNPSLINVYDSGKESGATKDTGWGYDTYDGSPDKNHGIFTSKGTRKQRKLDQSLGELFLFADTVRNNLLTNEAKAEKATVEPDKNNYNGAALLNSIMSARYGGDNNWKALLEQEDAKTRYSLIGQAMSDYANNNGNLLDYYNNQKWSNTNFGNYDKFFEAYKLAIEQLNNGVDNNAFTNLGFGSLKSLFAVSTKPAEQTVVGNHETDWKKAKRAELKNLFPSIEEAKIEELVNSEYAKYIKQQLENYNKLQSGNDFDLNFYPKVQEILNILPQYSFNFGTASPILAENTVVKEENDLKGYTINTLRSKTGELTNIIPLVLIEGRINENISPELKSKFWQALTGRALTVFDYIKTYPDDIPMLVYNYNANGDWSQQEYIIPNTYDDKTYSFLTYAPNTNTIVRRNAPKEFLRREPYENWKTSQEVPSLKEGGIIKAEYGIKFAAEDNFNTFLNSKISTAPPAAKPVEEKSFLQQMLTDNLRNDELKLAGQREVGGTTEGNYFEPSKEIEFSPRDYWLLSNVAADVTAALSAFIPGYGTATSAALGLGSTISQAGFDYTDDSQSFLSATGNTALNLGMDLIGLIPFLGTSSKGLKVVKTLAKSPKLITALVGVASANAIPGGIEAFRKITSGETLTVDDYRAIGATAQLVIGGWGAHLNYKAKNKFEGTTNYIDKEVKTSKGAVSLPVDEIEQIKAATNGKNLTLEELLKLQNEVYKQIQLRKGVAEKDIATLTIPYSDKSIRHARMSTTSPETGQNTPQHIPYTPDNPTGWKRYFNNDVAFGPVHGKRQVSTVNDAPTVNSTNIDGVAHLPEGLTNGTKVKVGALNATIIGYNSGTGEYKIQTSNGFDIVPASKKSATKVTQSDYKVGDKVTLEDGSSATIKKVNSDGKFEIEKSGSLETIESGKIKSKVEIIPKSLRTVLDDTAEQAAKTIGSTPESVTKAIALKAVETAESNTNLAELNVILNEYGLNAIQRDAVAKAINTKLTTNPNATIDDALWNRTELPGLKPAPSSRLTSSQINKGYTEPDLSMPAEGLLVINADGSTRKASTRQLAEFEAYLEEVQQKQKAAEEKAQKAENKRQQELRRQQQVADLKLNLKDAKTKVTSNVKAFLDKVNQLRNSKAKQKLAEDSKNALTPPSKPQKKQNGGSLEFSREVIARRNGGLIFKYGKGDAIATIEELGENSKDDLTAYTLGDKKGILYSNTLGKYYVKDSTGKIYIITGDPKHYQGTILDNIILDGIKKGEIEEFTGTEFDLHYSNPGAYYMLQTELNKMLEPTLESLQVNDLLLLDIHSENKTWWVGNRQFVAKSNDEKDIKLAKESAERYAKATGLEVTINNLVTRDTPEAKWNIEDFTYMDRAKEQSSTLSRQATAGYTPNSRANALNMEQTDETYKKFFNLFLRAKENGWESLREDERISAFNFLKKLDAYTFNNSTSGSQSHPVFKGEVGLLLDYDKLTETDLLDNWFDTVNSMMMDGPIGLWHTYPTLLEEKRGEKAAHWIKQADGSYTKAGDDFDATKYLLLHTDYSDDETDNWTDYYWKAKNVKVGSSGTTEQYTPNEKDLKAVYDKPFELPDIRLDNIVGAMRTAFLNRGNTKSYKAAIDWSPAMKDYIHRLELLEGDFAAKRASMDAGTRIMWEASKPRTTDARLQLASDLQGTHYKNLYDMQGNAADSKRFYETRSRIMNLANEDLLYNTAKHDDNVVALSAYDQFKAQSKANLIQQNYTNWNNYFTGLLTQLAQGYDRQWQLAMDKAKTNYISNLSAQENAYEYNLKNINDQYAAGKLDAKQYQEAMDLAIKLKSLQANKASEDYYNGSYNMVGPHLWTVPTANTRNKLDYFLDKKTGTYWKKDANGKLTPYTLTSKNGSKIPKAAKGKKKGLKANDLFRLQSDKDFNKALRDFINNVYKSFRNKK